MLQADISYSQWYWLLSVSVSPPLYSTSTTGPYSQISLSIYHDVLSRKTSTHRMPTWVRNILIQRMPGILMMRVPKQVVKGGFGARRSKYLRQADPTFAELTEEAPPPDNNGYSSEKPGYKVWLSLLSRSLTVTLLRAAATSSMASSRCTSTQSLTVSRS